MIDLPETLHRRARLRELVRELFDGKLKNLCAHIDSRHHDGLSIKKANNGELSALQEDNSTKKSFGDKRGYNLAEQIGLPRNWFELPLGSHLLLSSYMQTAPIQAEYADPPKGVSAMPRLAAVHTLKPPRDSAVIVEYETGGAMGSGLVLADQPGQIHSWSVSRDWIEKNIRHHTGIGNLCIVTGFGDSMRPLYNPGDPLLIDRGVKTVDFDGIYFFRIGDEGFIKRLQKIPGDNGTMTIWATSANPAYKDYPITEGMDFEVLGRVVRVWCGTDF
jgi:hypothetical protein